MDVFLKIQEMNLLVKNTNKGGEDISNQQVNLPKVSNGIYSYKISTPINAYTGKLKIIQNE